MDTKHGSFEGQGEEKEPAGISRQDFLKGIGMGIGAAGLASLIGGQALAAEGTKPRYIVVATHGGEDPNRAILALLTAVTALDKGLGSVHFWMTLNGAELANKTKAGRIDSPIFKKFGNAEELLKKLKDKGCTFGVCPPCAEYMGAEGSDKYDFIDKQGADWLMQHLAGATVVWL
jgi:predicted peroxiredoxin